jgi:membrane-associated phospholipid phosphatase
MNQTESSDILLHKNRFIHKIIENDYKILVKFYSINPKFTPFIRYFSSLGSMLFWGPFILTIYLIGNYKENDAVKDFGLIMFSGLILSSIIVGGLKKIVKRKRPYFDEKLKTISNIQIENRDKWFGFKRESSFPSGHICQLCYMLVISVYFLSINWLFIFIPMIILMIFARGHLGVHFFSDTLTGILFGLLIGYLTVITWSIFWDPFFHWIWETFLFFL